MTIHSSMLTLIDTVSETVKQSLTIFAQNRLESNAGTLSSHLVSEVSTALQASLNESGRAGLKAFVEQFESDANEIQREGNRYLLRDEACPKAFLSIFGEVEVMRRYYHCAQIGGAGIVPLDEGWDMQGRYATPEVVSSVLWASSPLVPGDLAEMCQRMCPFKPSVSCIQDIISSDGASMTTMLELEAETQTVRAVTAQQAKQTAGAGKQTRCRDIEIPEGTEVFVSSLDGANVLLREGGAKCGRPALRPGLDKHSSDQSPSVQQQVKDDSSGAHSADSADSADSGVSAKTDSPTVKKANTTQSPSSYKNAMVGSYSFYKTVDGVLDMESGLEGIVPERLASHYSARMPEAKALGFKEEFETIVTAIDQELSADVVRILLLDGARPLWNYIEGNEKFEGYHLLLDFFHASEHLSRAAAALFGKDTAAAKKWYEDWRFKLKYEVGAITGLLRSIAYHQRSLRLPKSRLKELETEIVFFKRNKERMNYPDHVAQGWPIGSGPVEAACKTIVKARLCQSGMRWSRDGGRNILALRVLNKSNQWDQAWNQYRAHHWQKEA